LYKEKKNLVKNLFSLFCLPARVDQHSSVFLPGGHRMPGCLPHSHKGKSAAPGPGHIQVQHTPTRPIAFALGFSAGKEAPEGQAVGQMCSSQLAVPQITGLAAFSAHDLVLLEK